jgi:hypothetical protein
LDLALRPLRNEGLDWCLHDEGGLITDETVGRSWSLNPVGLFIWDHCDGTRDVAQISSAMRLSFGIDDETAHTDLADFLVYMEEIGLIQLAYPAAS